MTLPVVGDVEGGQREGIVVLVCDVCSSLFWVGYQMLLRQLSEKQNYVSKHAEANNTHLAHQANVSIAHPLLLNSSMVF